MNKKSKIYIKLTQIVEHPQVVRASRIMFILIGVTFALSLMRNILSLRSSEQRITDTQRKLAQIRQENQKLAKEVEAVESDFYREKQGRDKLGLAKVGEIIAVLPTEEKLKQMSPLLKVNEEEVLPKPNWQRWLELFVN